jgi:hypothetical protein
MQADGGDKTGDVRFFCKIKSCDRVGIHYDAPMIDLQRSVAKVGNG